MAKKFMLACLGILALAAAFHIGARRGRAAIQGLDIAVATQVIHHGEQIPLPSFSDGTQARQGECTWIVYPRRIHPGHGATQGCECRTDEERVVWMKQYTPSGPFYDSNAQYLIIAVREDATSAQSSTWGRIKAEFGGSDS
jgi:hypothetical protein